MTIEVPGGYTDATDPAHIKLAPAPRYALPSEDPDRKNRVDVT